MKTKKTTIIVLLSFFITLVTDAQNVSKLFSFDIQRQKKEKVEEPIVYKGLKFPILNIVEGSIKFIDSSANNAIDAEESCMISFQIKNTGHQGENCIAKISGEGTMAGVTFSDIKLDIIETNETKNIEIPITSNFHTEDGQIQFSIFIDEPNGFGTDPIQLAVNTKAYETPMLQVVDYAVTSAGSSVLEKKKPFDLQLLLQNTQHGLAEDINVAITIPDGVFLINEGDVIKLDDLKGGQQKILEYSLIVNNNYKSNVIPIHFKLSEKHKKYAEDKTIYLNLNQALGNTKLVIDETATKKDKIEIASLSSDVDKNIPFNDIKNENTFAVIIANENYKQVSEVPFALNDGDVFYKYCIQTLGIPEKNIRYDQNATLNDIKANINWLSNILISYEKDAKVIFYYAGHGIPDEATQSAYILPVDGYGSDVTTGYKLNDLYNTLGSLPSQSITIFLDACFSGSKRDGNMLASARGIAIQVKSGQPIGNMVVFSAAKGDETAYPYKEHNHGMFTYFLLKKLQETSGNISYGELGDFINLQVMRKSIVENNKVQTPTVTASTSIGESWKNWKLK